MSQEIVFVDVVRLEGHRTQVAVLSKVGASGVQLYLKNGSTFGLTLTPNINEALPMDVSPRSRDVITTLARERFGVEEDMVRFNNWPEFPAD